MHRTMPRVLYMRANGPAIRAIRHSREESLEQVAARARITREALRFIETGKTKNARPLTVEAIAVALGVSLDEIVVRPPQAIPA